MPSTVVYSKPVSSPVVAISTTHRISTVAEWFVVGHTPAQSNLIFDILAIIEVESKMADLQTGGIKVAGGSQRSPGTPGYSMRSVKKIAWRTQGYPIAGLYVA